MVSRTEMGRSTRTKAAMAVGVAILSLAAACDGDDPASSADSAAGAPTESPSIEPARIHVPHVTGLTLDRATKRLQARGLDVGKVAKQPSARPRGTVLEQKRVGSSVTLVVAAPFPLVPDTTGEARGAARRELRRAGFEVVTTKHKTDSATPGTVIDQTPTGGTRAKPGSTVTITVAKKPPAPPPTTQEDNCTSGYSPCLPPASDYDCAGGSGDGPAYAEGPISVTGSDPYGLDSDSDGVACED